ncbi:pre-rRNA-processing protein esf1 [Malania oleifera]|uniref:pre-rRNA-processing protein esf1 n=1 Tax=Malania oleifera TaxID=397392 RepID=UPI0025AE607C|nr:pre-rRNA-processing protein esf1 [Malania oleifera]
MGFQSISHVLKKKKKSNANKKLKIDEASAEGTSGNGNSGGGVITDSRFSSAHSDPRFQRVPKHKSKVAIDPRFNRMFSDQRFSSSSAPLDKRGRPKKFSSGNPLRHYYKLQEEQQREHEEQEKEDEEEEGQNKVISSDEDGGGDKESSKSQLELNNVRGESSESVLSVDSEPSASEGDAESGGETDTDSDEEYEVDVGEESSVQEENIPEIEKETHRLAVVNMDWNHVKAVDLYVLLSSFLPKDGQILSVAVYPSEFGLKHMEEEEVHGPIVLFDDETQQNDSDDEDEIDDEKLRAYEKSRLRYYYAVVDCDSSATADYLYKVCDGLEFERSSNALDLRFIPDSMEFKHPPRDVATEAPASYECLDFHTGAMQHSKIHMSWDEDDPQRIKTLKQNYNADQLAELEFKEYLASDESETDADENDIVMGDQSDKKHKKRDMYRALIKSNDNSDDDGENDGQEMEITFNTGLEDISKLILEKRDKKSETVWEAYLRKRSEKKKARKNMSKYSSDDDESSDTDREAMEQPDDFFVEEPAVNGREEVAQGKRKRKEEQSQEADKEAEASRAELELLLADDKGTDTGPKGYNLKRKKSQGKKGKEGLDEDKIPNVDYDDPRFSTLFTSPLYALDPTDPQYKRSAAYARAQKQQKGKQEELVEKELNKPPTEDRLPPGTHKTEEEHLKSDFLSSKKEKHELSSLIKSIKMKSQQVKLPSIKKLKKDENLQSEGTRHKEETHELKALVQSIKRKARNLQK